MSAKPRRKQRTAVARLRPFWLVVVVLACVAGAVAYFAARSPAFEPAHITVVGESVVPRAEILRRARIDPHRNVWLQNMGAAASRIATIPFIEHVRIRRSLPANVRIFVTERRPYAVVVGEDDTAVVDDTLRVLERATAPPDLPELLAPIHAPAPGAYVRDPSVRRLADDLSVLLHAHAFVLRMWFDRFGDLSAVMRSGVKLYLGSDGNLPQKSRLIAPILSQAGTRGRIAAVDLRALNAPVVQYR